MSIKSILFNTEMVKAILIGRKTQTRRLVKNLPLHSPYFEVVDGKPMLCDENGDWHPTIAFSRILPGDVLWVRETWRPVRYVRPARAIPVDFKETGFEYKADGIVRSDGKPERWRPSIHMPREAARLFLKVTDVQIERLQDISPLDINAEGIKNIEHDEYDVEMSDEAMEQIMFEELWDSTIKPADLPRYGWEANPWVWVIEFERCEKPEGWNRGSDTT